MALSCVIDSMSCEAPCANTPTAHPSSLMCRSSNSNTCARKSGKPCLSVRRAEHASQQEVYRSFCGSYALVFACLASCQGLVVFSRGRRGTITLAQQYAETPVQCTVEQTPKPQVEDSMFSVGDGQDVFLSSWINASCSRHCEQCSPGTMSTFFGFCCSSPLPNAISTISVSNVLWFPIKPLPPPPPCSPSVFAPPSSIESLCLPFLLLSLLSRPTNQSFVHLLLAVYPMPTHWFPSYPYCHPSAPRLHCLAHTWST